MVKVFGSEFSRQNTVEYLINHADIGVGGVIHFRKERVKHLTSSGERKSGLSGDANRSSVWIAAVIRRHPGRD